MVKKTYILFIVIYCLCIIAYFCRYEISYRVINVTPQTIEQRDLTYQEHKALKKAISIRQKISSATLMFSAIVAVFSLLIWLIKPFYPIGLAKIIFFISFIVMLFLFIVNGVRFIPTAPIR